MKATVKTVNNRVPTANVAEYFNVSIKTIQCYLKISKDSGTVDRPSGSGRPKITAPTEDRPIVRMAHQNSCTTTVEIFYDISTYD